MRKFYRTNIDRIVVLKGSEIDWTLTNVPYTQALWTIFFANPFRTDYADYAVYRVDNTIS